MKRRSSSELSPAQLQIMNIVWNSVELGVAQIWQEFCRHRPVARNTVQTMLSRLHEKGWLIHRKEGNAFVYRAAQPRERVLGGMLSRLVDSAFAGSAGGLMLTLLKNCHLSSAEAKQIRELIGRAEREKGSRFRADSEER